MIYNNKSLLRYRYLLYNIFIMKKVFWLVSLLWVLILSWCWSSTNVIEYNDSFVALVKECTDANQALYQNFNAEWSTIDSIIQTLQDNINICQNAQEKASKMWDYDKDSSNQSNTNQNNSNTNKTNTNNANTNKTNPQTEDKINMAITIFIISAIGLVAVMLLDYKENRNIE